VANFKKGISIVKTSGWPDFVRALPEAELPFDGLRGWLLESESGQVLFMEADVEVIVPQHSHGNQWGVVIEGTIDLTIGEETQTYTRGATYIIPTGTPHRARIHPGFRAIDYFVDRNRYRVRQHRG
jgi:mannose-6-phosphate isomerase-like protein (cupin superfamily)